MRRMSSTLAGLLLASLSLSGCWLQVGFDAGHTRHNTGETALTSANVGSLTPVWAHDLLAKAAEPIVRGGRVYVVTGGVEGIEARTDVRAYGTVDGQEVWNKVSRGAGEPFIWEPSFVGEELWTGYFMVDTSLPFPVGTFAAPLRLDPADGSVIEASTDALGVTAPVEAGDHVVQAWVNISAPLRQLVVRDRATLATAWSAELGGLAGGVPGPAPAVVDGQVFLGDGVTLYGFPLAGCGAATCAPTWTLDLGARPTAVVAAPGGSSVFVTRGSDLLAVDRATGTVTWTAPLGAAAPGLALADDSIYVATGGALDVFPAAGCGAATCAPTASGTLDANATAAPVVAGGVVYVGMAGAVQGFDTAQGPLAPLVTLPVAGAPSSLVVDGGRLFVVTAPGGTSPSRLVAFAPTPEPGGD